MGYRTYQADHTSTKQWQQSGHLLFNRWRIEKPLFPVRMSTSLWTNIRIIAGYSLQEPKLNDDIRYQKQQVRQRELEKDLHPAKFQPESIHNRPNRPR